MTKENQFIHKLTYESFISDNDQRSPAQVLGQVYFNEQNKESFDLSYIRFAQGEIYYHYQDYETAIFKWGNIENELKPWATKNIGDAYYKLGLLSNAKEKYTSVTTEDKTLSIEIAINLFNLYKESNQLDQAYEMIKKALNINPDYPRVTTIAREFYEENNDYESAVRLAVQESNRTEKEVWFSILISYIKEGHTKTFSPEFFAEALLTIFEASQMSFTQFIVALWNSYRHEDSYFHWLKIINEFFQTIDVEQEEEQIVSLFKDTFEALTNGTIYLNELHEVVPHLLANWIKLSPPSKALLPSAAVLAWNEIFPGTLIPTATHKAEACIFEAEGVDGGLDHAIELFQTINSWAAHHTVDVNFQSQWWLEELTNPSLKNHFMLAGKSGNGKTTFVNSLLGDEIFKGATASLVVLHDDDEVAMNQITKNEPRPVHSQRALIELLQNDTSELIEVRRPCILLHEHQSAIIDTPSFNRNSELRNILLDSLLLVDGLLYVLDGSSPLTDEEIDFLYQVKKFAPELKVHFLLNKSDLLSSDAHAQEIIEEVKLKLAGIYPHSEILPYSSLHPFSQQLSQLNGFLYTHFPYSMKEKKEKRVAKVLTLVRRMLADLLKKRVDIEKGLIDSIHWNEDLLTRLKGFTNKISDLQQEKTAETLASFRSVLKGCKTELKVTIPTLLRETKEIVNEDSDFREIHTLLNKEMNEKIKAYIEESILPNLYERIQEWVSASHDGLLESQSYLMEMSETFNEIYQNEKLKLECDFIILEDWHRDIGRLTDRIQYEEENIMLQQKPAQILLKGAGKFLGGMTQNKKILANQYIKYIESETYEKVVESISRKLFLPFELFEKGLNKDIAQFFKEPINEVNGSIAQTESTIVTDKEALDKIKENPEFFYDPLKIFEVHLLIQEFILKAQKDYSRTS